MKTHDLRLSPKMNSPTNFLALYRCLGPPRAVIVFQSILSLSKNLSVASSFLTSTSSSRLSSSCSPAPGCSPQFSSSVLRQSIFLYFFSVIFILKDVFSILPRKEDIDYSPSSLLPKSYLWSGTHPILLSSSSCSPSFFFPPSQTTSRSPLPERSLNKKDQEVCLTGRRRRKSHEKDEDTKDQEDDESSSSIFFFTSSPFSSCLSSPSPSSSFSPFFSSSFLPGILASEAVHTEPSDPHHAGLEFDDVKNLKEGPRQDRKERSFLEPLSTHLHESLSLSSSDVEGEKHLHVSPKEGGGKHLLHPLLHSQKERDKSPRPSLSLTPSQEKQEQQGKTESHEGEGRKEQEEEAEVGQEEQVKKRRQGGEGRVEKNRESYLSRENSSSSSSDGAGSTVTAIGVGLVSLLHKGDAKVSSVVSRGRGEQGGRGRRGEEDEGQRKRRRNEGGNEERRKNRAAEKMKVEREGEEQGRDGGGEEYNMNAEKKSFTSYPKHHIISGAGRYEVVLLKERNEHPYHVAPQKDDRRTDSSSTEAFSRLKKNDDEGGGRRRRRDHERSLWRRRRRRERRSRRRRRQFGNKILERPGKENGTRHRKKERQSFGKEDDESVFSSSHLIRRRFDGAGRFERGVKKIRNTVLESLSLFSSILIRGRKKIMTDFELLSQSDSTGGMKKEKKKKERLRKTHVNENRTIRKTEGKKSGDSDRDVDEKHTIEKEEKRDTGRDVQTEDGYEDDQEKEKNNLKEDNNSIVNRGEIGRGSHYHLLCSPKKLNVHRLALHRQVARSFLAFFAGVLVVLVYRTWQDRQEVALSPLSDAAAPPRPVLLGEKNGAIRFRLRFSRRDYPSSFRVDEGRGIKRLVRGNANARKDKGMKEKRHNKQETKKPGDKQEGDQPILESREFTLITSLASVLSLVSFSRSSPTSSSSPFQSNRFITALSVVPCSSLLSRLTQKVSFSQLITIIPVVIFLMTLPEASVAPRSLVSFALLLNRLFKQMSLEHFDAAMAAASLIVALEFWQENGAWLIFPAVFATLFVARVIHRQVQR
ncbi:hypothetical protein CSUI_009515 [Cystoisospora suis]|uniref:Transmembrane protein n=1 Tax=Cystoisospora suis TaxID=483139 RepID=A0A2C6KJ49_9APIC|nr:hypothetical protein CSUI_009515 [Cystoisospora suis]